MNIIYSVKKLKGVDGVIANPNLFNGDTECCTACYTDDLTIKRAYELKGIQVFPITQKRVATPKKEINEQD